ncbi:dihydroorotate dehydrogenase electron transfer subunit [Calycomorphotria hydatis]|uniref:Dihydroorotate dehydrogenase B (NAD(+)), electron transfer subunit n=1 Tax=Calycomorphotria hydatis TaxID=2528027 RepID=A0A517T7V8_9PLAN|nr:dihydroorotate dehydrogenase electron transfer subunit [Calycomorphotria hydatis]QDT64440.1 Dihydroorotate dehydrogenase B (NAD(+)), electron transfer subunit [Calycomorphotria hydatis]
MPELVVPSCNPTTACEVTGHVVEQVQLARNTYRIRLHCPELAERILPGQFVMVRPAGSNDPLLGRPFALYDTYEENGETVGFDFGYVTVGKLTSLMPNWKPGTAVEIWGPLGNGFPVLECNHLMMVAGGIGQTPFIAVSREQAGVKQYGSPIRTVSSKPNKMTLCYGVQTAEAVAALEDFNAPGLDVQLATDDGTQGHHGYVTDLSANMLTSTDKPDLVYCCGPEPMMAIVARQCEEHGVPCLLSLESPMACGFGACFSCVVKVKTEDGGWDYRRSCIEGPVFRGDQLILE